jgi:hypothetical protein
LRRLLLLQHITYKDVVVRDEQTLSELKVGNNDTLVLVALPWI